MDNHAKTAAIILAAGKGTRMQSRTLKQYLTLENRPVLFYSLDTFSKLDIIDEIILVVSEGESEYCKTAIVDKYKIKKVSAITEGGAERYLSVQNGLKQVSEDIEYVMVHDSARPLITAASINKAYEVLTDKGACVVGVPVKDTIKQTDDDARVAKTLPRSTLWTAQTPQCFKKKKLAEAYNNMYKSLKMAEKSGNTLTITDDAMIVEEYGGEKVWMVLGEYTNIKITTPEDMELAKLYMKFLQKAE